MKRLMFFILLIIFILSSKSNAQGLYNEMWGSGGFTLALPKLYSVDLERDAEGNSTNNLLLTHPNEGAFGLYLGLKLNLYETKNGFYFGPSVYYQKFFTGTELILFEEDLEAGTIQEIKKTISEFSINGDFYYKIPKRERDLYVGAGVGVHNVKFVTNFKLDPPRTIINFPDFDPVVNNEINESETKVSVNLIYKVKIVQNLFLEGRFELMNGLNQFKLVWTYKLWDRKKHTEKF